MPITNLFLRLSPHAGGGKKRRGIAVWYGVLGTTYIQTGLNVNRDRGLDKGVSRDIGIFDVRYGSPRDMDPICNPLEINHNGQNKKKAFGCCHIGGHCVVDLIPERY